MSKVFIGTKEECEKVVALIDKQQGYPKKGVNVGGGIHVEIPDEFYPGAPGWTETHARPVEDAQKGRGFAVNVEGFEGADKFNAEKLSAKERADLAALTAKLQAAAPLPKDWHAASVADVAVAEEEPKLGGGTKPK